MPQPVLDAIKQGAIEQAEKSLKENWSIVRQAAESNVEKPTDEQFNQMATELINSGGKKFNRPDTPPKSVTYKKIQETAREFLKDSGLSDTEKQNYLREIATTIPTEEQFKKIAEVTEQTGESYNNWWTKLNYGFQGFAEMIQKDGIFPAIMELLNAIIKMFSGDFSMGKIGEYGTQIAADDVQKSVSSNLKELAKDLLMQGTLDNEMIDKIAEGAKQKALEKAKGESTEAKTPTTPEQRLANVRIKGFGDMAEASILKILDTKLRDTEFVAAFRAQAAEREKNDIIKQSKWLVSETDILEVRDVIKKPLEQLLTSDELKVDGDQAALKAQVVTTIKQTIQSDEKLKNYWMLSDTKGANGEPSNLDAIAEGIADQVVQNQALLKKAHAKIIEDRPTSRLDKNKDGALTIDDFTQNESTKDAKLDNAELDKMDKKTRAKFDALLQDPRYGDAVMKDSSNHVTAVDFSKLPLLHGNANKKGIQLGK